MRNLSKEEMINAIAEVMVKCEIDDCEEMTFDEAVSTLTSDEIGGWVIEEIGGITENFDVSIVSNRGGEGDGADMWQTFYVKSLTEDAEGYLEYDGRYSSWDSSYYYESYVVKPEEVLVTKYRKVK